VTTNIRCLQCILEQVIQLTEGSLVATAIAIVGRTEHGHNILVMTPVKTLQIQHQQYQHVHSISTIRSVATEVWDG